MREKVSAEAIERGHSTDLLDVRQMIDRGLVEPPRLLEYFSRIEDQLYKVSGD